MEIKNSKAYKIVMAIAQILFVVVLVGFIIVVCLQRFSVITSYSIHYTKLYDAIAMTVLLLNYNKYGVTQFDNTSLILIKGDLTSDNFKKGDLVFVESRGINDISVGDEIFVYKVASDGSVSIDLGTIGEVHTADEAITFENGSTYSTDFVVGEASKVYNKIGTYLSVIESSYNFV